MFLQANVIGYFLREVSLSPKLAQHPLHVDNFVATRFDHRLHLTQPQDTINLLTDKKGNAMEETLALDQFVQLLRWRKRRFPQSTANSIIYMYLLTQESNSLFQRTKLEAIK